MHTIIALLFDWKEPKGFSTIIPSPYRPNTSKVGNITFIATPPFVISIRVPKANYPHVRLENIC